jgi:EVE domain
MSEASDPGSGKSRNRKKKSARASRSAQHWMIVSSIENFRKSEERGFTVQGIKARHRRRAEMMRAGDRLLYYVTGRMAFTAVCTLTSSMFEEHTHVWRTTRREEDYPWRVRIRPDVALEESEWVPAKELAYRLEYVRKWPPEHWTLAFQGHVHQLPQKDFKLIEDEIRRLERARPVAS